MTTDPSAPPAMPATVYRLGRADLTAFARAIVIGVAGGTVFNFLNLPLPWMLGSMFATGVATLGGVDVKMDSRLRTLMILVLGVLLGSAFSPEIIERIPRWPITLASLFVFVLVSSLATFAYYRFIAGFDARTAFFSGIPGGLNEMIALGGAAGADERQISVAHTSRIFLVIMVLPFLFRLFSDFSPAVRTFANGGPVGIGDIALLAACAVVGLYAARMARIPAPHLTGPMIASAAVHLSGLTAASPPLIVVATAQVVIGASVGARFAGLTFRDLGRIFKIGGIATAILLLISALFAVVLNQLAGFPFASLILAFSPGGLTEMSLIALALKIDTAFVATHHMARIAIVVIVVPVVFRLLERSGRLGPPP